MAFYGGTLLVFPVIVPTAQSKETTVKRTSTILTGLLLATVLIGCGGGTKTDEDEDEYQYPAPAEVRVNVLGIGSVMLNWTPVEKASMYVVFFGFAGEELMGQADQGISGEIETPNSFVELSGLPFRNGTEFGCSPKYVFTVIAKGPLGISSEESPPVQAALPSNPAPGMACFDNHEEMNTD